MVEPSKRTSVALETAPIMASASFSGAAHACIVTQTYEGTVLSGTDEGAGFFDNTNLTGQLSSATYVFDDEPGSRTFDITGLTSEPWSSRRRSRSRCRPKTASLHVPHGR